MMIFRFGMDICFFILKSYELLQGFLSLNTCISCKVVERNDRNITFLQNFYKYVLRILFRDAIMILKEMLSLLDS